jgi:hypothetical protein
MELTIASFKEGGGWHSPEKIISLIKWSPIVEYCDFSIFFYK